MMSKAFYMVFLASFACIVAYIVPSVHCAPSVDVAIRDTVAVANISAVRGDPKIECGDIPGVKHAWGNRIQEGARYLKTRAGMCGSNRQNPQGDGRISCSYSSAIYISSVDTGFHEMYCQNVGEWIEIWLRICFYTDCPGVAGSNFRMCKPRRDKKAEGFLEIDGLRFTIRGDNC